MFLTKEKLEQVDAVFKTPFYSVIENKAVINEEDEFDLANAIANGIDVGQNYLIVNGGNGAVEFAVDQLPAAIEVAIRMTKALKETKESYEKTESTLSVVRSN